MEITTDLHLSDEQLALLDQHAIVNVLNVLSNTLELVGELAEDPSSVVGAVSPVHGLAGRLTVGREIPGPDELGAIREAVLQIVDAATSQAPTDAARDEIADCRRDVVSAFDFLRVRLAEFKSRTAGSAVEWQQWPIRYLQDDINWFLSGVERHARGRYRIVDNVAEHEAGDYLIHVAISNQGSETVRIPVVLKDVLRDLIANARKYSPPGSHIDAGLHANGTDVVLRVTDNGRGIPLDEIPRVVKFGYRARNVQDVRTMGAGFGLTRAYLVTQRLGGRFEIESTEGEGTDITIRIPIPALV